MRFIKKSFTILLILLTLIIALPSKINASDTVPRRLNYQGRLMDSSDNLLTGTYYICFSIWDNATVGSGSQVWPASTPTPTSITTSNGVFSAEIGSADTLDLDFDTYDYYLQVYVNTTASCSSGGETLSPRQHLTSAAYAINADTIDGYDAGTSANQVLTLDAEGDIDFDGEVFLNDGKKVYLGTGDDAQLYVDVNDDLYIANATQDQDIVFQVNDSGSTITPLFIQGSTGNVGIGTTDPSDPLTIVSGGLSTISLNGGNATYVKWIEADRSVTGGGMWRQSLSGGNMSFIQNTAVAGDFSSYEVRLHLDYDGNVGVGTNDPGNKLDIVTGDTSYSAVHIGEADNEGGYISSTQADMLYFSGGSEFYNSNWYARSTQTSQIGLTGGSILFRLNTGLTDGNTFTPTEVMRIDSSGNVGIGTTSPSTTANLNIVGANGTMGHLQTGYYGSFSSQYASAATLVGWNIRPNFTATNNLLYMNTTSSGGQAIELDGSGIKFLTSTGSVTATDVVSESTIEAMRIDTSGNVGIGTTSPQTLLDIGNLSSGTKQLRLAGANSTTASSEILFVDGAGSEPYLNGMGIRYNSSTNALIIDDNYGSGVGANNGLMTIERDTGYVGIGTTSPNVILDVQNTTSSTALQFSSYLYLKRSADNVGSPQIRLIKSRGDLSARTIVSSGDGLGTIGFYGYDGTSEILGATINAEVDATASTSDMPGRLTFATTADGASTPTEHLRIDSSGNIGIGTNSPQRKLHFENDSAIIRLSDNNATTDTEVGSFLEFYRGNDTSRVGWFGFGSTANSNITLKNEISAGNLYLTTTGTGNVIIDNGYLGLGISPSHSIDIKSDGSGDGIHIIDSASTTTLASLKQGSSSNGMLYLMSNSGGRILEISSGYTYHSINATGGSAVPIYFMMGSSPKVTLDTSGQLGIGTTDPGSLLEVNGGSSNSTVNITSDSSNLISNLRVTEYNSSYNNLGGFLRFEGSANLLQLGVTGTDETDDVVISIPRDSVNVGIGTTASLTDSLLTLGYNSGSNQLKFNGVSYNTGIYQNAGDDFFIVNSRQSNGIVIYDGGSGVDINYNGSAVLEADSSGGIKITGEVKPSVDNTYDLGTSSLRWDDVYATNGTIQTSDRRDKMNIINSSLGLDFINNLTPVSYNWISGNNTETHYGFIAQDVEETLNGTYFGGLVYDKEVDKYSLRYSEFIAPIVKAIQEQQIQINELGSLADNEEFMTRLESIEKEITGLKELIAENENAIDSLENQTIATSGSNSIPLYDLTGNELSIQSEENATKYKQVTIANEKVTENTQIILTSTTPLCGNNLYVKEKEIGTGFTVALEKENTCEHNIEFDWLIIESIENE